ncbi:hypothetical protein BaRGS_00021497 [Batillaria attramentaria]|uniref:Uncharacterized protein n=1 Tax=Batillaria attramentaria TaxID=370345 RepID=A0ABD0KJJ3_9CAEN
MAAVVWNRLEPSQKTRLHAFTLRTAMYKVFFYAVLLLSGLFSFSLNQPGSVRADDGAEIESFLPPTVVVALLVRNKAHTLPWFLGHLELLEYPKDRISLWIRSDHNVDNTTAILKEWISAVKPLYHSVDTKIDEKQIGASSACIILFSFASLVQRH